MWAPGTAAAIRRSAAIYLRDADRRARMERLLARFVRPGGLAFDIGAHLGDRSACFARLGARVVALEPQPAMFRALRLLMRGRGDISLLNAAAGAEEGRAEMFVNTANPTVSSLSAAFVAAGTGPGWAGERWDRRETVPVVTLDTLIDRHGLPDFVKIDVEGHEAEALRGLFREVPALSFEVTSIRREVGHECLDRLAALGSYRYNLSLGETHRLRYTSWIGPNRMRREIDRLSHTENSADIYGILRPSVAPRSSDRSERLALADDQDQQGRAGGRLPAAGRRRDCSEPPSSFPGEPGQEWRPPHRRPGAATTQRGMA